MELSRGTGAEAARCRSCAMSSGVQPGFQIEGTVAWIRLPTPLAPGSAADFEFSWAITRSRRTARRVGNRWRSLHAVAYWYPQFAVYDDVNGRQTDWYMGNAEFYMGYADYGHRGALDGAGGLARLALTGGSEEPGRRAHARDARATRADTARTNPVRHRGRGTIIEATAPRRPRPDSALARGRSWLFEARNARDCASASDKYPDA